MAFDIDLDTPVVREDGKKGTVDLALSTVPLGQPMPEDKDVIVSKILNRQPSEGRHHLVIELKRPSEKISSKVLGQTESYAFAVAMNERFQGVSTNRTFWSLSNEMTPEALFKTRQKDAIRHSPMAFLTGWSTMHTGSRCGAIRCGRAEERRMVSEDVARA